MVSSSSFPLSAAESMVLELRQSFKKSQRFVRRAQKVPLGISSRNLPLQLLVLFHIGC